LTTSVEEGQCSMGSSFLVSNTISVLFMAFLLTKHYNQYHQQRPIANVFHSVLYI